MLIGWAAFITTDSFTFALDASERNAYRVLIGEDISIGRGGANTMLIRRLAATGFTPDG